MAEGNICERNTAGGMWQELGYVAIFRGNYSRNNPKSAQILIAEAGASEKFVPTIPGGSVYGNITEIHSADQSGIAFRVMTKAQRGNGPGGEYFVRNYSIHHNHIVHRIAGGKSGALGVGKQPIPDAFVRQQLPYGNNHFDANIYHVPVGTAKTGTYWTWGSMKPFEQFQADGHEAHGSVIEDGATWQDMTPPPVPPVPAVSGTATDPVLTGTTEPAAMILVYEGTKLIATACADDTGKWSAKLTGLSVGSHTLKVDAADPAKNVSGYSTVTAVTVSNGANVILFATQARSAETLRPDLKAIGLGKGWKGATALTKLVEKDGAPAIEFNKSGANVVWLDGFEFADGVIEFDAKGKSMPPQSSFVGIAFRVRDAVTYDAVYFRPFNFRADEAEKKSHAVQYVSEPEWPWQRLRKEKTGQYEKPITPAPDGDQWFHARIVIAKPTVTVYVNGANQASLEVKELADRKGGSVGLWCNGYGLIANLKIAPAK